MMRLRFIIFMTIVFLVDRLSKQWALLSCISSKKFSQFVSCELAFNRGISWSFFENIAFPTYYALLASIVMLISLLCLQIYKRWRKDKAIYGELLIVVGAFSNMLDRFLYGGVVDFIVVHYQEYSWPVFNIADCAIVLGALLMVLYYE